ncbi:hypothetical protein DVH24_029169 [Malus domestica]|uniref:Pentatricopeptide repeat-containing protein n=1 Tax=Malus domestica TaxID=3750 RepID=A0A498HSB1_MALDO|nr:hypothetical protein DVH24_029169 [Malus domestica]
MMAAYSRVSNFREVLSLFRQMQEAGTKRNESVLVILLTTSVHISVRYVEATLRGFEGIPNKVARALNARAGTEEADQFVGDKMGGLGRGNANGWAALPAACGVHGNVEVGDQIWKKLAGTGVADCGFHVLSYNMYKEAGREFEAKRGRNMILEAGMKKKPGSSVIEVNGVAEEFLVGDLCHPQA